MICDQSVRNARFLSWLGTMAILMIWQIAATGLLAHSSGSIAEEAGYQLPPEDGRPAVADIGVQQSKRGHNHSSCLWETAGTSLRVMASSDYHQSRPQALRSLLPESPPTPPPEIA